MASEYGSWPVEAAAHQIRSRRALARAAISAGIDGVAEMLERQLVAEKERLVRRHRLDDVDGERLRPSRPLELQHEFGET